MIKRIDAYEKVTGRAIYADDLTPSRLLHAKQLYAEYPHAKILNIYISSALKVSGVIDIITANDCPGSKRVGGIIKDHYVLADGKVLYHGDVVAVVAAENYQAACNGAAAIKIDYEPLTPILDPVEALKDGSAKVHEERENNIVESFKVRHGDTEKYFAKAGKVFEAEFKTQFVEHAYMEPESCVAIKNPDGSVTIHGGMQHPFSTRRYVADFMGMPLGRVRIIQTTLGGGFGGKDDTISVVCARAALLAVKTGRPVKLTLTREESMRESYKRHPFNIKLKMAVDNENKIQAYESNFIADGGPYCATSPFVIWRPTVQCTGPYKAQRVKCDSVAVYTNNTFTGAMRGFGTPQYNFAVESFMDIVAHELKIDPFKFRHKNFFEQNDVTHTGQTLGGHRVSILQVTTEAMKKFCWNEKYAACSFGKPKPNGNYYGIGMACSYRGVSLGAEGNDMCSAIVNIQPDGSVILEVGVAENGQGLKTVMTRFLCVELGIDPANVTYPDVNTSSVADSCPTVASRGTIVGGNAVLDAVRQIKKIMEPVLAKLIGKSQQGYIYTKGTILNPKTKKEISFKDAVAECHRNTIYLYAMGSWRGPKVSWREDSGQGDAYFTYVYGCDIAEVEIDGTTGKVSVPRAIGAHDVGRAVNPQMLLGQIYGGIVMGMGQALTEEVIHINGKIENTNFNKYKLMRSTDVPEIEAIIIENPDPAGPWGAKSIGEPTNELMAGAIANAVFNATGYRTYELPIRAEKILEHIRK